MIEIVHDELEDKEFVPTFAEDDFEDAEVAEDTDEAIEEESVQSLEDKEPKEDEKLAPIVEMQPKTDESAQEEKKEKTIVETFGGLATFIEVGLQEYAKEVDEFQECLNNEKKSLEECIKYVIGEVQQKFFQGTNGTKVSVSEDEHGADLLDIAIKYYETEDAKPRGMFAPPTPPKAKTEKPKKESKPKKEKQTNSKKEEKKPMTKEEFDALSKPKEKSNDAAQPKVFSALKKGSKAYNEAILNQLQGDLFGDLFNDNN